ncbi:DUF421 domain-containing protein [Neobacillus niacini]|uniref:DUF421 domain-containing protein n=1 Tax=Neobacillus niacini TaxID=86668 RepID=UPI0021CB1E0F|nr:DUF421 domain-containing protein [Neobacillus niacini]MCM3763617.1 DUF421 domain-containing protein [Neobacillus niacini]
MSMIEVFARAVGAFIVLLLLTRIMGRKQVSELTFFNYVTGISIGAIAGTMTVDPSLKFSTGLVSLLTWCGLTVLVGFIGLKSKTLRKITQGEPVIVIKQGKVLEHTLKKLRLDMDELQALLRTKDVFSIEEVDYGIMETSGELTVLLKESKQPLTRQDAIAEPKQPQFPIPFQIISNGEIIEENLQQYNLSKDWVHQQLAQSGTTLSNVFYAELQQDGSLYIDKREDQLLH